MYRRKFFNTRKLQVRKFACSACRTLASVSNHHGIIRKGRVRAMWCHRCNRVRIFVQN